jgi:hypothetical protein
MNPETVAETAASIKQRVPEDDLLEESGRRADFLQAGSSARGKASLYSRAKTLFGKSSAPKRMRRW